MAKKKLKAKIHKARIVKVKTLAEDKHLVAAEFEVHGPVEALPEFTAPVEINKETALAFPAKHWYDFLTDW